MVLGPAEPQRCGLTAQIGGRGHVPVARQLGLALPLRALRAPGEQDIEHSRLVLEGQVYVRVLRNGTVGDAEVRLRRQVDHVLRGREQEEGRSRGVRTLGFGRKLAADAGETAVPQSAHVTAFRSTSYQQDGDGREAVGTELEGTDRVVHEGIPVRDMMRMFHWSRVRDELR